MGAARGAHEPPHTADTQLPRPAFDTMVAAMNSHVCRRPWTARPVALWVAVLLWYQPGALARDATVAQQWPPIKLGLWKLETTRVLPTGKKQHRTESAQACTDGGDIFMGYWGGGTVEKEGCEYHPVRVADDKYKITTVCIIRGAPPSTGTADVTLKDGTAFQMEVTVTERKKTYRLTQSGHRVADCPKDSSPKANP